MMRLWDYLTNWWMPRDKVNQILDSEAALGREMRAMAAQRDALRATKRALEIETEIRLRTRGRQCYADNS